MKDNKNLLPCPFCGGRAEVEAYTNGIAIKCMSCGCKTEVFESDATEEIRCVDSYSALVPWGTSYIHKFDNPKTDFQKALEAWNRRTCSCKKQEVG